MAGLPGRHGSAQVLPTVDIPVHPAGKLGLRALGKGRSPLLVPLRKLGQHRQNPGIVLMALAGLQGGNEFLHLRLGLLVLLGQQHSGLQKHQVGGHGDKLPRHLQVQRPPGGHPGQKLGQNARKGDVPNGNPILLQQMEDQIQRAHKVLGGLRAVPHHTFNVIDRAFHGRHISRESTPV